MKMKIWNILRLRNDVLEKEKKAGKIHTKITYSRGMPIRRPGSLKLKNLIAVFTARILPFLLLLAKLQFCRKI